MILAGQIFRNRLLNINVNLCTWVELTAGLVFFLGNPLGCALAPWGVDLQ